LNKYFRKYSAGLVLSGGAIRGIAHLGVIQACIEKKILIDIISGTSAGALVGAFFAQGFPPEEILKIISGKKIFDLFRLSFPGTGFFKIDGLRKILTSHLKAKNIEDLPTKLIITVTNIREGKVEYLSHGPLVDSLIASASIPALFEVTHINSADYIDGGVLDNLPVEPLRNICKKIIAVYVNPLGPVDKIRHPAQMAERAFHLAISSENRRKIELVDYYIEPWKLISYGMFDLKKADEIYRIGYEAAIESLSFVSQAGKRKL
jgi:NTE family protein